MWGERLREDFYTSAFGSLKSNGRIELLPLSKNNESEFCNLVEVNETYSFLPRSESKSVDRSLPL